jgi:hypothetical protein
MTSSRPIFGADSVQTPSWQLVICPKLLILIGIPKRGEFEP